MHNYRKISGISWMRMIRDSGGPDATCADRYVVVNIPILCLSSYFRQLLHTKFVSITVKWTASNVSSTNKASPDPLTDHDFGLHQEWDLYFLRHFRSGSFMNKWIPFITESICNCACFFYNWAFTDQKMTLTTSPTDTETATSQSLFTEGFWIRGSWDLWRDGKCILIGWKRLNAFFFVNKNSLA